MLKKFYLKNLDPEDNKQVRIEALDSSSFEAVNEDTGLYQQKSLVNFCITPTSTNEHLSFKTKYIDLFEPMYWRVDGPLTSSFAIVPYENGWEVNFQCRYSNDLIGIVWDTIDAKDHKYLAYETVQDFTDNVWTFDLEYSERVPDLFSETLASTITVEYYDSKGYKNFAYIALRNYATEISDRKYTVEIDWNTVKSGFEGVINFPKNLISKIFFAAYSDGYSKVEAKPLPETIEGFIRLTNSKVTGPTSKLKIKEIVLDKHDVGVCTSYDDHYDLNPARIVHNLKVLGYNGFINHYCGMSHYPESSWDEEAHRFYIPDTLITGESVVNKPTLAWHNAFASELAKADMKPVYSVSWELYSQAAREEWCQREWDDTIGRTGYEPPSYFISMCNEHAIAYLHQAYLDFAYTLYENDCQVIMQVGEPWHWFNTKTLNPCVYDYQTRLAFHADTGLYAPDLGTIITAMDKTGTPYDEFKDWLRDKLGMTCRNVRQLIKNEFGDDALVCPLIFFPSIKTHNVSLATHINYPVEHYKYPNFDFMMTEAYDWVIEQPPRLDLSATAVDEIPTKELGYPLDKVYYLSGFVPDQMIAYIYKFDYTTKYRTQIWERIFGDIKNNKEVGIRKQLIWAYPQVMADSISIISEDPLQGFYTEDKYYLPISDNTPYTDDIINQNAQPPSAASIQEPVNVSVSINTTGDLLVSFDISNYIAGSTFSIEFLDIETNEILFQRSISEFSVKLLADETNFDKTYVKVLIRPSVGLLSGLLTISPTLAIF